MKVLTVVGARPQFIKAAPVSRELARRGIEEFLVHTGQHYDYEMSQGFFDELDIPKPFRCLDIGSGSHAAQTARMMLALEPVIESCAPHWVLIYGDTNSTIAGALVAAKLNIPIAHVEAGLRSFDQSMPEEVNRIVADHVSALLLAPTEHALRQLERESVTGRIELVGDVMIDLARETAAMPGSAAVLATFGLVSREFGVLTVHRAATADDPAALRSIIEAVQRLSFPVVFPVHPRTRGRLPPDLIADAKNVRFTPPISYRSMIWLLDRARVVLTDSGGLQKEAVALGVPCVTLRETTEWVETLENGWNRLAGCDTEAIVRFAESPAPTSAGPYAFAPPSAQRIVDALLWDRPHGRSFQVPEYEDASK